MGNAPRILVASALGDVVLPPLEHKFGPSTVAVAHDRDELDGKIASALRFDVVVVDLVWQAIAQEWSYDGLDAMDQLVSAEREAPVILAVQGHGRERDYLTEAYRHPLVKGALLKAQGLPALLEAVEAVSTGGRHWGAGLPGPTDARRLSVGEFLSSARMVANVAGAIATGVANNWSDVADLTQYSIETVQTAPAACSEPLYKMGAVPDPRQVTQATIFRWCGEHAQYILSWCRRHGHGRYERAAAPG